MKDSSRWLFVLILVGPMAVLATAKAPAPPVPEGGPLPPGAVLRLGDRFLASNETSCRAFSPDGKRIVASSDPPGDVRVFDVTTGKEVRHFTLEPRGGFGEFVWSPDGKLLGVAGGTGIRFLDAETGKERFELKSTDQVAFYTTFAFAPDGKSVVWRSGVNTVALYDLGLKTERWAVRVVGNTAPLAVEFASDGHAVAVADNAAVSILDTTTGKKLAQLPKDPPGYSRLAFAPDGKTLAVAASRGLRIYNLAEPGENVGTDPGYPDAQIGQLSFAADGKTLNTTSGDECIIWDLAAKKVKRRYRLSLDDNPLFLVSVRVFSADGKTLAWQSWADDRIHLTDVATGVERHAVGDRPRTRRFAFTPDGKRLLTPCGDGNLRLWDATTGKLIRRYDWDPEELSVLDFTADGKRLVAAGKNATIWDAETGKIERRIEAVGDNGVQWAGALLPDGKTLALGELRLIPIHMQQGSRVSCWDLETGRIISCTPNGHLDPVRSLAFAPDGKTLAALDGDRELILWATTTGKSVASVACPPNCDGLMIYDAEGRPAGRPQPPIQWLRGNAGRVAYAADGKTLVTFHDAHVFVRSAETGKEVAGFDVPAERKFLACSGDGARVAWLVKENTVVVTDISGEKKVAELKGHEGRVQCVVFSADGKHVATGSADGTILIWDLTRFPLPVGEKGKL